MKWLAVLAVWAAKLIMFLIKLTGLGRASSLPGKVALRVCPSLLGHLGKQTECLVVTGTNGKTTTANMLAGILEHAGYTVLANREGANLLTGVATAFARSSTLGARINSDYAVLEIDEAVFPVVIRWIKPRLVVVTNFFRDQLDRYGELDITVSKVVEALNKLQHTVLVLNADDPLVARIARESDHAARFYGVFPDARLAGKASYSREAKFCSFCGKMLSYRVYFYSQLGDYKCTQCGFGRPQPDTEAAAVQSDVFATLARVRAGNDTRQMALSVGGLHNLYNALAAVTAAQLLGVKLETAMDSLQCYRPATGRMEIFAYGRKQVVLTLVKNPAGFNQALAGMLAGGDNSKDVLMVINDNAADGRDISWLWDVDFEVMAGCFGQFTRFVCSGQRAEDMALRLKYAGVPVSLITVEKDYRRAIASVLQGEGTVANIMTTYTALWPVEKILSRWAERAGQHAPYGMSHVS